MAKQIFAKRPEEVFTPRNPQVNPTMYISRPLHELRLTEGLEGTMHVVVYGESGSGKSWLYKKVLSDESRFTWFPVNLANSSRQRDGSIVKAIAHAIAEPNKAEPQGYTESKQAEIGLRGLASGGIRNERRYEFQEEDPFFTCLGAMRAKAKKTTAVLVLDNLEAIYQDSERMEELANLILLCDDAKFSSLNIKLLIVGVASQLREYYSKTTTFLSVTTRLIEVPEVSFFTKDQTDALVERGFVAELGLALKRTDMTDLKDHVHFVTLGLPFHIHEYCLVLARAIQEKGHYDRANVRTNADATWLGNSLSQIYGCVEGLMNSKQTRVGRKNQVLYALGKLDQGVFDASKVETILRHEFPDLRAEPKNLNVGTMLGEIEGSSTRPLRRFTKGNQFAFNDPKFRMCLRTMLHKGDDGRIIKLELSNINKTK